MAALDQELDQNSKAPEFFRILQDRSSFAKLLIPKGISRYLDDSINGGRKMVTLFCPVGKFWHINVEQVGHRRYLGSGWEKFVYAYDLEVGNMVLFHYQGNMVFTVDIYSADGCRIEYDPSKKIVSQRKLAVAENRRCNKVSIGVTRRGGTERKPEMSRTPKTDRCDGVLRLERVIKDYHLTKWFLNIPCRFSSSANLQQQKQAILKNSSGEEWNVGLRHAKSGINFSWGWRQFAMDNNLQEGDMCSFEHVSGKVLQVEISKADKSNIKKELRNL